MSRGLGFGVYQQLFVELLARAQASTDDFDVPIGMGCIAETSRSGAASAQPGL